MQLDYSVDMTGWTTAMHSYAARASRLDLVHDKIGDFLVDEVHSNFETSGGAERWAPLKPFTVRERRRKYPNAGDKIMIVTRELFNSFTKIVTRAYVDVGSPLKKSRELQFGRPNMEPRSFFQWREGVMDRVADMYLIYLFGDLKH